MNTNATDSRPSANHPEQAKRVEGPLSYRSALTAANTALAADPRTIFLGYGITKSHALGTLRDVPPAQLLEMPVAENLMVGAAIGLSLAGRLPVVYIERCDFLLNALDAIVNHLNAMPIISRGEFRPAVILRIVVGNRDKPLFTGHTHTQDFFDALHGMVQFPVIALCEKEKVAEHYLDAAHRQFRGISTALFEYKDLI